MRRPWQVGLIFTLCLLAAVPAMLWVTWKAIELDRAEFAARLQAEQEEVVSRALWRIDAQLMPMLAEEAARPDFVYQTLGAHRVEDINGFESMNYLETTPPHVLLHFELKPSGNGSSPQLQTVGKGMPPELMCYQERLDALVASVAFDELLKQLPEQSLPQLTMLANYDNTLNTLNRPKVVANNSDIDSAVASLEPNQQAVDVEPSVANDAPRQQVPVPQSPNPPAQSEYQTQGDYGNAYGQQLADRGGNDLRARNSAYQSFTQRAIAQERGRAENTKIRRPTAIREGICRPLWAGDKLLFARRVVRGRETVIQGCWLDWESLRTELLENVSDLVPAAQLMPIHSGEELALGRVLATLPVKLVVPPPVAEPPAWSPIRIALSVAWACLAFAGLASAWLLMGVVALSERRASFVSAVTHELRTPLTTFRMYAEMLASGMVTAPEQRQKYLETLCVESDRLTHLVDNVLLYARLERGRPGKNRTTIRVEQLLDRFTSRLADRAEQSHMKLAVECDEATRALELSTDPGAVEQIVFNLIDNACKYAVLASDKRIVLSVQTTPGKIELSVCDFGPGLTVAARRRLFQPFSKTSEEAAVSAPGVGLGLALCKRLAHELSGHLRFVPKSPGACFVLELPK